MFTAAHNDKILDIYRYDSVKERYVPYKRITSTQKNSRMGGGVFRYKDSYYYPAQDCSEIYGGATDIKRIKYADGNFSFDKVKHLTSPNSTYSLGLHTMNEYKGVVVIDVHGWRFGKLGACANTFRKLLYNLVKG